jgi:hypothetical protein
MTLEEIWDRILEYIDNHNTTENIFNYSAENNSEQNLNYPPAIENNSKIESQRVLQPNPHPSPPFSPLTLPEFVIPALELKYNK